MSNTPTSQKKSISASKKDGKSLMEKIEKVYGKDFGIRSDMKLETYLKKAGYPSLAKMLKGNEK